MSNVGQKTKIDSSSRERVKVEQTFFSLLQFRYLSLYPLILPRKKKNMRKIYLICIVFWRQTDGKIHDELIIVSLFSLHPLYLSFFVALYEKKNEIFTNGKIFPQTYQYKIEIYLSIHSTLFTQLLVIAMIHQEHFSKKLLHRLFLHAVAV